MSAGIANIIKTELTYSRFLRSQRKNRNQQSEACKINEKKFTRETPNMKEKSERQKIIGLD